jgi:hypothetical protein
MFGRWISAVSTRISARQNAHSLLGFGIRRLGERPESQSLSYTVYVVIARLPYIRSQKPGSAPIVAEANRKVYTRIRSGVLALFLARFLN